MTNRRGHFSQKLVVGTVFDMTSNMFTLQNVNILTFQGKQLSFSFLSPFQQGSTLNSFNYQADDKIFVCKFQKKSYVQAISY